MGAIHLQATVSIDLEHRALHYPGSVNRRQPQDERASVEPTVAFSTPTAVEIVGERVYVVDRDRRAVFVLDLAARTFDSITTADGLPFEWLSDIAAVDGMIAVTDSRRGAVSLFDADGQFVRTIVDGLIERPTGIAWSDAANGLWVLDTAVHACLVFGIDGTLLRSVGRRGGRVQFADRPCACRRGRHGCRRLDEFSRPTIRR